MHRYTILFIPYITATMIVAMLEVYYLSIQRHVQSRLIHVSKLENANALIDSVLSDTFDK